MAEKDPSRVSEARKPGVARDAVVEPDAPRQPHPAARRLTRMLRGPENAAHCAAWCSAECRDKGCKEAS